MLTSRLYGGTPVTDLPPTSIEPASGSSKPPIILSVVVLPQPDGPSNAKNEPRGTSSVRASTASTSSKLFVTSLKRTSTSGSVSVT